MYDDNEKLIRQYQEGRSELLGVIIENNTGLIHTALKSFKWAFKSHPKYDDILNYDDFFQEGVIGLSNAIKKFNPDQGAFSSFAILHIKQIIYRYYYNNSRVIRVPYEPRKAYMSLKRVEGEYIKEYGYEPSTKELSVYSGVSFEEIQDLRRTFSSTISIDSPVSGYEDDSMTIGDSIPDKTDYLDGIEREMAIKALRRDLERMAKNVLKDDERVNLLLYYFDNLDKKQINEIAEKSGLHKSSLNRFINDSTSKISRKYLDELIEGYADLVSSNIRRTREKDLHSENIRRQIKLLASKLIQIGDSITVLGNEKYSINPSVQVTVKEVGEHDMKVVYIGYSYIHKDYREVTRIVTYSSINDFRTENKKIVEITTSIGLV